MSLRPGLLAALAVSACALLLSQAAGATSVGGSSTAFDASQLTRVHIDLTPTDPNSDLSGTPCSSSLNCWPYQSLDLPAAWDVTTGSSSIIIADVDTGVNASHPDLTGGLVLPGATFLNTDGLAYLDGTGGPTSTNAIDDQGHGTATAGIIGARIDNAIGIAGVCGACRILPVKVLDNTGSGWNVDVAAGIEWATDHGARIINLSLGGPNNDPVMEQAVQYAVAHGVLVIAAAGNESTNVPHFPAGYTSDIPTGLISVAATDATDTLYGFSNHGSWVQVAAPGCANTTKLDGTYESSFCGTSASTPFVSGIAGLILSQRPTLPLASLQDAIVSTTRHVTGLDVSTGGVVDAAAALASLHTPTHTGDPALTGTAQDGHTLSVGNGTWSGVGPITYAYAWSRCDALGANCSTLPTATAAYAVVTADVGSTLKATVTPTNAIGTGSPFSTTSSVVTAATPTAPANTALPTISDAAGPVVGDTASATTGTWTGTSPISFGYQWQSSPDGTTWTPLSGATASTLAVTSTLLNLRLRVTVTATNTAGSATATTTATAPIAALPANTALPTISDAAGPVVGDTASATTGTWTGTSPISYADQWQSSPDGTTWTPVSGATTSTLPVTSSFLNLRLRIVVTATNGAGPASATSAATASVANPVVVNNGGGGGGGGGSQEPPANIKITLTADQSAAPVGGQIVWRITASDAAGAGSAPSMHVQFTLSPNLTLAASQTDRGPGCGAQQGTAVDCNLDNITATIPGHIILFTNVTSAGDATLIATGVHDHAELDPSDDTATATVPGVRAPQTGAPTIPTTPRPATPSPKKDVTISMPALPSAAKPGTTLRPKTTSRAKYQWQLAGASGVRWQAIPGAKTGSLRLAQAWAGKRVRLAVTVNGKTVYSKPTTVRR